MIYLFHGDNWDSKQKKIESFLENLRIEHVFGSETYMDVDSFSEKELSGLIDSKTLFDGISLVTLRNIFQEEDYTTTMVTYLPTLSLSPNIFLINEGTLKKDILKKISQHSKEIFSFEEEKLRKEKDGTMFALADACGERNKKKLWILYQKFLTQGVDSNQILGILFWQIKTMLMARDTSGPVSGINPYVLKKVRGYNKNYTEKELQELSKKIILLHGMSREGVNLEIGLEKLILSL